MIAPKSSWLSDQRETQRTAEQRGGISVFGLFLGSVQKLIGDEEGSERGIWAVIIPLAKRRVLSVFMHRGQECIFFSLPGFLINMPQAPLTAPDFTSSTALVAG